MATDPYSNSKYRDPDRGFRVWARNELVSETGSGLWVPNVGDMVFDKAQGWFVVYEVDYDTGYSVLEPWSPLKEPEVDADDGMLVGSGPGYTSESYRIFLNTEVTPHTFSPDKRLMFKGSMVSYYKVFLGSDVSEEHGVVISAFYGPSNEFLGTAIPTEDVVVPGVVQQTGKALKTGYTSEALANGELVTVVGYSDDGGKVSQAQLVVMNSTAIPIADNSKKYVKGIKLDSPYLSPSDPQVIEFPLNVTVESLPMSALVLYNGSGQFRQSIDGSKFSLLGLRNYIATQEGQEFPLVLTYQLAEDEISYNQTPTAERKLTLDYIARTTAADGAYQAKLFVYPVWVNASAGYRLEYWLYNLHRQTLYNVTPYIELGTNSNAFNPTLYGTVQTLTVALDLNEVDGRFKPYRHVQTFQISLLNGGDARSVNWEILFTPDQTAGYGRNLKADLEYVSVNYWKLRLANGFGLQETWLRNLYEATEPLYNTGSEDLAPTPTHFRVRFLNNTYEYSVAQWNTELIVNNDLADGDLVYIEWIKRTYDTDLQLAISAVPVLIREG